MCAVLDSWETKLCLNSTKYHPCLSCALTTICSPPGKDSGCTSTYFFGFSFFPEEQNTLMTFMFSWNFIFTTSINNIWGADLYQRVNANHTLWVNRVWFTSFSSFLEKFPSFYSKQASILLILLPFNQRAAMSVRVI